MNAFRTIYKRQLFSWFCSPIAHVTGTVFLLIAGLSFCRLIEQSLHERMMISDALFGSVFFWGMVLMSITLITMGMIADEKKSGAIEMLLSAPVTDAHAVLAKYCAALTCFAILCLPTVAYLPVLNFIIDSAVPTDWTALTGGYGILLAIASCYIAFGVMISSLTKSPAIAACICFAGLSTVFFSDIFRYVLGKHTECIISYLSPTHHIMDFAQGVIDSRPLVLYISGTAFFIFTTVKILESRHWR